MKNEATQRAAWVASVAEQHGKTIREAERAVIDAAHVEALAEDEECADCGEALSDVEAHCDHCGAHIEEGACQECGKEVDL